MRITQADPDTSFGIYRRVSSRSVRSSRLAVDGRILVSDVIIGCWYVIKGDACSDKKV